MDEAKLKVLERHKKATGAHIPALDAPMLYEELLPAWEAFWDLHRCRTYGQGPNPLSFQEISAWLDFNGIDDLDDKNELLGYIKTMDEQYLTYTYESIKKDLGNGRS